MISTDLQNRADKQRDTQRPSPLLRENFRGSDKTLVSSSLGSNNSSRSNVNTAASSSFYSNSNADLREIGQIEFDDDDDDDDDGLTLDVRPEGNEGVHNIDDDEDNERNNNRRKRSEELETDKGLWDRKMHYILLSFGAVFGLRNILEFPALAIKHGGGAFLFVYVVLTYFVGLPIVYLEVSLGQYARGGVVTAWRIMPLARGIAMSSLFLTLAVVSHSLTPAAWALYYLYSAIADWLPLEHVPHWLTNATTSDKEFVSDLPSSNISAFFLRPSYNISHHHFYTAVLEVTDSISSIGHMVSRVFTCLIILWIIVFMLSALGPKNLAKVSFCFTAVPSVLMIAVLFIVACTLPGSVQGIQAFLNPKWGHLSHFEPWLDALDLVLSGLACGTGILITLSGHCKFHGNTFRNAMGIASLSLVVTVMSGCLILALLGVEALRARVPVDQIRGLADYDLGFVLFPAATTQLPKPALWSGIFFGSVALFAIIQGAVALQHMHQGALDFLHLRDGPRKWRLGVLAIITAVSMALNLLMSAQNGLHVMRLLQISVTRLTTPFLSATQCLVVGWGYGARRFAGRVLEMTGRNKSLMWKWLWRWGCPLFLTLMIVTSFLTTNLLQTLPAEDRHKKWLHGIGWALNPIILLPGLAMALTAYFRVPGTFKQRLKQLRATPPHWGPGHPEHEPQADLPDYVICHPDPFRPANALAMLTANLYLPNIINFSGSQASAIGSEPKTAVAVYSVQHVLASAALAIPFSYFKPPGTADPEMVPPSYLSAAANPNSEDDESSASVASDSSSSRDGPRSRKRGLCGRCHASIMCLSHVIGLGNLVRFPYLVYKHGGGVFLIAYFILLLTCGLPLVIVETAIGQYSSLGPIKVWRAVPIFKGVGYSMVAISGVTSIYYGVICSWAMLYLVTSMTSVTPWGHCNNVWNTNSCITIDTSKTPCLNTSVNDSSGYEPNCTELGDTEDAIAISSSVAEYFYRSVVEASDQWGDPRELRWQLSLCLLTAWTMVALALIKGIKPGEKATYFIMSLTTITLIVLFVRASSLAGGNDGLRFLFTPQWSALARGQLWRDAATQVFFSLSLGSGTLVAIGTYNKFNNDLFTEAAIICGVDSLISVLSSLVVFAVLGSLCHITGQPLEAVARPDLGLQFVALSHATNHLPGSLFWSGLSFLTLVVCGVFTCASLLATVVTSLVEVFAGQLKKQKVWLVLGLCSGAALLGFTLMVQAGFNVVNVLDRYLSGLPEIFTSGLVVCAFAWVYGVNRFSGDVSRMINSQVGWWWRGMWGCVCPCLLLILIIISLVSLLSGGGDPLTEQPWFTRLIGMLPLMILLVPIVVCACHEVSKARSGILVEKIRRACKTRREWGATEHRCSSHVEYFPTVHTHMGIDISLDGLNTVTDRVEFSPVGVRVPSLSQTSLLPVSPDMRKTSRGTKGAKVRDMRHTAILNHAYSNPQCNLSSGSLEKSEKKKRMVESPAEISKTDDVIFVKRKRKKVPTCDASTQTDRRWHEPTLFRQRSQPSVRIPSSLLTPKEKRITRSSSWHQLGQPAVLEIDAKCFENWVRKDSSGVLTKDKPRVHSSSSSSGTSTSSKNNNRVTSCKKDFSSCVGNDNIPLSDISDGWPKRGKIRGKALKNKTRAADDIHDASFGLDEGNRNNYVKRKMNKFNRSMSCDESKVRVRNSSSSSTSSTSAKAGVPKQEKVQESSRGSTTEKKRRCGQSVAPNLNKLMRQSSLPQGQLPMTALARQDEHLSKTESFALTSSSVGIAGQRPLQTKRGFRPESGNLSGRKCADTVVRLSNGKSTNHEVCALSVASVGASGVSHSKTARQFPGSLPVDTYTASGKAKTPAGSKLNKLSFNECSLRMSKPPLRRSESETARRDIPHSEQSSIRPVVSQPSISGYNRLKAVNGSKATSSTTLPHTKRKTRSKSMDECAESETPDYYSTNSLLRGSQDTANTSRFIKGRAESLPSGFGNPACTQRDVSASVHHWFADSSKEKDKSARPKYVSALPLSHKELVTSNANQFPLQQVYERPDENSKVTNTELILTDSDPAIVSFVDEGVSSSRPTSSSCSAEEGNVILEETEIDLELDKDEHELLVSSSSVLSLPSSLSSPSPSSTLLQALDSAGPDSSNL